MADESIYKLCGQVNLLSFDNVMTLGVDIIVIPNTCALQFLGTIHLSIMKKVSAM